MKDFVMIENTGKVSDVLVSECPDKVTIYYGSPLKRIEVSGHLLVTVRSEGFAYMTKTVDAFLDKVYELINAKLYVFYKKGKIYKRIYVERDGILVENVKGSDDDET